MKTKPGAQINQSILDGISVLQALAGSDMPVGGKDLAERLNMDSTRVNRLLKTLASIGMTQQTKGRKYIPGPGIHVLSAQSLYASGLLRSAMPTLEQLGKLDLTVAMGVLWFDTVSFIYHAKPGMRATEAIGRMGVRSATTSGIGMVMLANSPRDAVIDAYQNKVIEGFPDGLESLLSELEEINQRGYALFQSHELQAGNDNAYYSLAMTIGSPANSAIALQGKIKPEDVDNLVCVLKDARAKIESTLGEMPVP